MTPNTDASPNPAPPLKKPRLAYVIATALGVGFIPDISGMVAGLIGVLLTVISLFVPTFPVYFKYLDIPHVSHVELGLSHRGISILGPPEFSYSALLLVVLPFWIVFLVIGLAGLWSTSLIMRHSGQGNPPNLVIDRISGQQLTFLLGTSPVLLKWAFPGVSHPQSAQHLLLIKLLDWKYLILGFLAFQLLNIWKPFPIPRLKKLPGSWAIMADDWMAGIYAATLLRVAVYFLPI